MERKNSAIEGGDDEDEDIDDEDKGGKDNERYEGNITGKNDLGVKRAQPALLSKTGKFQNNKPEFSAHKYFFFAYCLPYYESV